MSDLEGTYKESYSQWPDYKERLIDIANSEKPTTWSMELINALEWRRFEELCTEYYKEKGFTSIATEYGADGGVDIKLFRDSYSTSKPLGIVQCKAWNTNKVGVKPIRELYGVMAADAVEYGVFVTSGEYTTEATAFSKGKKLKLLTGVMLLEEIKSLPVEKQQRLLEKITSGDYKTPSCPSCGKKMVIRTSRKGKNVGGKFWGCTEFPRCRSTLKIREDQLNKVSFNSAVNSPTHINQTLF